LISATDAKEETMKATIAPVAAATLALTISGVTIQHETVSTVVETLKLDAGIQKKWKKAADSLRADGVTAEMLESDKDFRKTFKVGVILLSFTKLEQAIYAKPRTALSDEEKVTVRFIQTEMGSRLSRVLKYVRQSEKDEQMTDDERGAKKTAELATKLKKDLTYWIEKVEKAEAVTFSATQMIQHLKAASALIK
jgi:hypothetical protein